MLLSRAVSRAVSGQTDECDATLCPGPLHIRPPVALSEIRILVPCTYETISRLQFPSQPQSTINLVCTNPHVCALQANRHPGMKAAYTKYLDGLLAAGLSHINHYTAISAYSKHGSWGLLEW